MTIPVLYSACRQNPGTEFVMLTKPAFSRIFINAPENLTVVGADLAGKHKGVGGQLALLRQVRPTVLVDLHDVLRSWVLRLGMHARLGRVAAFDKAREAKRRLTAHGALAAPSVSSTISRYADAFRRAGLTLDGFSFDNLYEHTPADAALYASLSAPKQPGEVWVGAAPFAAIGFFSWHGMTAEKAFFAYLRSEILMPNELKFKSINLYDEIERSDKDVRHTRKAEKPRRNKR